MSRTGTRRIPALMRRPSGAVVSSSESTPLTIFGSALEGWWRGDNVTTTGSAVDQMDDLSGNGRHMVQGTSANKPTTSTLLGQDAVRFDPSVNDQWLGLAAPVALGSTPYALWAVFRFESSVSNQMVLAVEPTLVELRQSAATGYAARYLSNLTTVSDSTTLLSSAHAVLCESNGTNAIVYVDNVSEDSDASGSRSAASATWALGRRPSGSFPCDMTLCEAGVISGAITSGQRADLKAYFADRYGL